MDKVRDILDYYGIDIPEPSAEEIRAAQEHAEDMLKPMLANPILPAFDRALDKIADKAKYTSWNERDRLTVYRVARLALLLAVMTWNEDDGDFPSYVLGAAMKASGKYTGFEFRLPDYWRGPRK